MAQFKFFKAFLIIWALGYVAVNQVAAKDSDDQERLEPKAVIQGWQLKPEIPKGWEEIDRKVAKISGSENDVFVLMTDGKNDQIVWFQKAGKYWKMSVIESIPSEVHREYERIDIKQAGLEIRNSTIFYGKEGTEAIAFFEWRPKEKIFIRYVPFAQ